MKLLRHVPHQSFPQAMFWQTAEQELPQRALDHGAQRAMAWSKAFVVDTKEPLDVLADESEQRRIPWPSWSVNPGADLHTSTGAGGRGTGGCTRGSTLSVAPTSPAALTPNDENGHQRQPGGHPMTQADTVRRLST